MVIDTSAIIALLLREPTAAGISRALTAAVNRRISAPSLVEATAVMLARKGPEGDIALGALLRSLAIEVVPMSVEAGELARSAYARYGKGVGNPGVLTYGDCLAYGVAKAHGEPLLYTGDDFSQTDITPVPLV